MSVTPTLLVVTANRARKMFAMATLLISQAAQAAQTADTPPLFAAPGAGHATGPAGSGSFGQVTIALAVVLAFVFVAAWALRHLRKLNIAGNTQQLQVIAQVALGAKERAVLIRVNDMQVLVGVAPGQVTALHTFTGPIDAQANAAAQVESAQSVTPAPSFQSLLKKSLGLS